MNTEMGITQKEADALESEFLDAMPDGRDYSEDSARKLFAAGIILCRLWRVRIICPIDSE